MTLAIDIGTHYARVARVAPDGSTPGLVDLPGGTPDEGLALSTTARGSRVTALTETYDAFRARHGPVRRIVVVLPQREKAELTRQLGSAFAGVPDAPELRPLGTPHAVLALLRHSGSAADGRYVVCDLGARAADISVCAVTGHSVALVDAVSRAPAEGLGDGFDAALLADAGLPADAAALSALAAVRREDGAAQRLQSLLARAERSPGVYDSTTVHWLGDRQVRAGVVRRSLAAVTTVLDTALDGFRVGGRPSLVAVGGLSRLSPLHDHLGARHELVALPGEGTDPCHAAVLGAALVAAGLVDPGDRYPHAVCVGTHRMVAGELRTEELEISPAGTLEPGAPPVFAESGGQRVRIRAAQGAQREVVVSVRAVPGGAGVPVRSVRVPPGSPGERCHLGIRLSVEGIAHLVLQPVGAGAGTELPLGPLPVDLTGVRR
ncbi:hypothetical protein [Streptomyces sp. NPDC001530]|uniref:hypothetical protein n=1 Tax=Streptomyces sp. NPDC001530 TaxID=3364582 RepID=UPI0036BAEF27